jgi:2',3'-cyclic-nucleotide 2'-phosphodiesterase (5'-nucleotidase family)
VLATAPEKGHYNEELTALNLDIAKCFNIGGGKMKLIKFAAAALMLLLAGTALCKTVNIYHTSDVHGYYFPRVINGVKTGGYETLAKYLRQDESDYLLLDSGDWTSGTAEAKNTKGYLSVQFMNMLGYDATTIGNHEFDFGDDALIKNISSIKFDVIAANMYDKKTKTLPEKVKPFKIYLANGKKIAVIGLGLDINRNSPRFSVTRGRGELKKAIFEIKKQNPDAVVLLTHMSVTDEETDTNETPGPSRVLKGVEGVDLVLGGHAHRIVQNESRNGIIYAEDGTQLVGITKAVLDFDDKTGKLKSIKTKYVKMETDKIGEDPYVKEFSEANRNKELDKPIGSAKEALFKKNRGKDGAVDSPLANIFADLVKTYSGADIGIQNTGGIRTDITKGPVTKRIISEVFPFPNKVMLVSVNGNFIKKMVQKSLKNDGSLFQYSGMTVKYKMKGKKAEITEILINGVPVESKKMYSIGVNDYIAGGGAEGYMFKKITDKKPLGNTMISDLFIAYIQNNHGGISPAKTGRIIKEN